MSRLLGIDVGTSHCKAGLFEQDGTALSTCTRPMQARRDAGGFSFYQPDEVRATLIETVRTALEGHAPDEVAGIGIASMAETGLLIDTRSGEARSPIYPWFDTSSTPQADWLAVQDDPYRRFCKSGIYPGFKVSLARLLWQKQREPRLLHYATWLSMADAVAFWLTGRMATEYSLAGRTYAFRIDTREWDRPWLTALGIPADLFPQAYPAGERIGDVQPQAAAAFGLQVGTPVTIAGHDHVVASLAAGVVGPGEVFDSQGTAESLLGVHGAPSLGRAEQATGLSFGCHVVPRRLYWLGGLSTSGGSLDWLRRQIDDPALTYAGLETLLAGRPVQPSGILYFPYLAGAGSPRHEPRARAAFIGLSSNHTRADLAQAVLEGVAFEIELMRRTAAPVTGRPITTIRAAGGGTRVAAWMQIRADVTGCTYIGLQMDEATLLGAALLGGVAAGVFSDPVRAQAGLARQPEREYTPDPARHESYNHIFEQGYMNLQDPLRAYYKKFFK